MCHPGCEKKAAACRMQVGSSTPHMFRPRGKVRSFCAVEGSWVLMVVWRMIDGGEAATGCWLLKDRTVNWLGMNVSWTTTCNRDGLQHTRTILIRSRGEARWVVASEIDSARANQKAPTCPMQQKPRCDEKSPMFHNACLSPRAFSR